MGASRQPEQMRAAGQWAGERGGTGEKQTSAGLSKDSSYSHWNWLQAEKAFWSIVHQEIELFSGGNLDLQVKGENKAYVQHEKYQNLGYI